MHYKEELLTIIKKHIPQAKVYLFGSRARGTNNPGSDIDLAIDANQKIPWSTLGMIKEEIEESTIPLFVDIVDLHDIDDNLKIQIQRDGKLWND